jgi:hypothetical protein
MLNLVLPLLKGQALHMVKNAKQLDPNINWSTFRKQLLTCFKTETNERRLIKEFNELKQKGNFDEFINKFMDISTQLPMISVDEKRRTFIKALKPNIQFELLKSNVNDLDEVIRVARIYEECHSSSDHKRNDHGDLKKVNFAKTHFPKKFNFKKKNFTKSPFKGGLSQNGQKFVKSSNNPLKKNDITCFKCKKKGHVSKFCKVKVHQVNTIGVQEDFNDDEEAEHKSFTRLVLTVTNNDLELPKMDASINGLKMKVAFDSGATVSCMSYETARKNNISILPSNTKIKVAGDLVRGVMGKTEDLEVDIDGHSCKESFIIIEHEDHDVLLGLPWFIKTGAGLYPKENILHFSGQNVHLDVPS